MSKLHTAIRTERPVTLLAGHCLDVLKGMKSESVNCCVTSPPYWGLRDYQTASQVWSGRSDCNHNWHSETLHYKLGGKFCTLCGSWLGSLGLEPTPELYIKHIVLIFREVRRVLKRDGTLWLVLGDSYGGPAAISPLKPKDLVGIPWQVALALREDGWYLRTDIVWNKPNPMPENVRDRPTRAHEYVFLLAKQKRYYYDHAAVAEPIAPSTLKRMTSYTFHPGQETQQHSDAERRTVVNLKGRKMPSSWMPLVRSSGGGISSPSEFRRNARSVWTLPTRPYGGAHFATFPPDLIRPCILAGCPVGGTVLDPFMGAGTTALVAHQEGRKSIGIELNQEYMSLARDRVA